MNLKDLHELQAAEDQAAAEDAERKEHHSTIGAMAIEPAPETSAPGGNQAAMPKQVKAIKVAREAIWYRLTKREQLPLAKTEKDEGLVLFTGEEEGDAYVFVTCRLLGDNRDDELSRVVDRYQVALEKYGIASERVMRNLRPHLRVKVIRTDADVHKPAPKPHINRSLKRMEDDDQIGGMGI
jgi:hypothetical protein